MVKFIRMLSRPLIYFVRSCLFNVHGSVQRKYISIHIQQDATLHSLFICGNCSTCFGWYLHPSSGAHNCIYSIWHLSNRYCYLPLIAEELELQSSSNSSAIAVGNSNGLTSARCCRYSCVLLMMGGDTNRNM